MSKCYLVAGASSGIGYETSKILAKKGDRVVLVSRNIDRIKSDFISFSKEVSNFQEHLFFNYDFSQTELVGTIVKEIFDKTAIDGLVYCVGNGDPRKLKDLKYDVLLPIMQTNFFSFVELVRTSLSYRKSRELQFNIVAVSSLASTHANTRYYTAYTSSKAALEGAIRVLAPELVLKNACICAVKPGYVSSPRLNTLESEKILHVDLEEHIKKSGFQPAGFISPITVAKEICYLLDCSDLAFSGAIIPLNGAAIS